MIIKVIRHDEKFTTVFNEPFQDPRISCKARGVLMYLLTKKGDWEVRVQDIVNNCPDGKPTVYAALKELRACGYADIHTIRKKGKIFARQWIVSEIPLDSVGPFLDAGNLNQENLNQGKQHHNKDRKKVKTNCGGKDSLRSSNGPSTNGFFEVDGQYPPFIKKATAKLEEFIRTSRRLNGRRFNRSHWYHQMNLLLQDIEGDKSRLRQVLEDYITKPHTKHTPQAESAEAFRKKFDRIEIWLKNGMSDEDRWNNPPPNDDVNENDENYEIPE